MTDSQPHNILKEAEFLKLVMLSEEAKANDVRVNLSGINWKLISGMSCEGLYLYGASLSWEILNYSKLNGANLRESKLIRAELMFASLSGANLTYANMRDADLRGARLEGANLTGADMYGAKVDIDEFFKADNWHLVRNFADIKFYYEGKRIIGLQDSLREERLSGQFAWFSRAPDWFFSKVQGILDIINSEGTIDYRSLTKYEHPELHEVIMGARQRANDQITRYERSL